MDLIQSYARVRESIVAFVPRYIGEVPIGQVNIDFPPIIGTGFVVRDDGLIITNEHVVEELERLPRPTGMPDTEWPFQVLYLRMTTFGMLTLFFQIVGVTRVEAIESKQWRSKPDVAVVHANVRGIPALEIDGSAPPVEGEELATAGFPMGTNALTAPGYLHQLCPTLQRGIVSAVLPFSCEVPHGFKLNVMVQGGASGSPVFRPESAKVAGCLYASLSEVRGGAESSQYMSPTNISYVVPAHYLVHVMKNIEVDNKIVSAADAPAVDQIMADFASGRLAPTRKLFGATTQLDSASYRVVEPPAKAPK